MDTEKIVQQNQESLLDHYIQKNQLNEYFSTDMRPFMRLVSFKRNEYICRADEPIRSLFFFVEGKAKVNVPLSNGKSLLLCFYKPLMVIGDAEILISDTASSNLQAIEDSLCVAIDFDSLKKQTFDDAVFLRYMSKSLSGKLLRLSKYSSINLLYPLENRLASYLLVILSSQGEASEDKHNLTELAELLGTSYRHLLRTLNSLVDSGAIRKSDHFYKINDLDLLRTIASDLYE